MFRSMLLGCSLVGAASALYCFESEPRCQWLAARRMGEIRAGDFIDCTYPQSDIDASQCQKCIEVEVGLWAMCPSGEYAPLYCADYSEPMKCIACQGGTANCPGPENFYSDQCVTLTDMNEDCSLSHPTAAQQDCQQPVDCSQ